ncbi:alkaline phosphatase [Elizabethkingia sp. HvH-WGS333]|uniref:DedA family protein n=1 Tax=Elizabethkingia TaxID=308865 RepID=UPI00074157F0|nr:MULTISPECIES: VTT domain-containing protein [Elizabethkingia]KUG13076.1 alkaline phosphatase [Elizabethkingia miricola]MCP1253102.1 VTT domain-containing protein [Elizabethkingia sp. S0634]MDX8568864.1 VTT domain-containing protein [Elizabethkingia sp. HX XZB]NHQ66394.1 DedA family protein [Elizabethkingia miricola]NHQ69449.1 DedA family protein [Elizabethkingia miricola]
MESWKDLLSPEFYINNGGLWVVLFIVFAETGLFVGFFLPGDSLLFVSGMYATKIIAESFGSTGSDLMDTTILASLISLAAIIGNMIGYWFGYKSGPMLYERKDTWIFKKKYLFKAHDFFEDHGKLAVIMARFLPVVRTFAPIVAGIVKMEKGKFILYNVIGGVLWSFSLIFAGHYLKTFFENQFGIDLTKHLEWIIIIIVIITTAPVLIKLLSGGDKKKEIEGSN